ncbi:MAG: site-specific DNA-methyltransferase, partial [Fimbriimonadaceae bacterium]
GTASENTRLRVHLDRYTARNTFDYFIHKDLGGFLRRELDFYIKNEVMHLDDVESETAPRVEQYLSKIKVIRRIAHKIIDFLAQLEDFQKKLWLKKKFVVETSYCIRLGVIPEEFYPEIAANDAQREEWVRLCAIDEIKGDLTKPGYSVPLTVEFLKAHPTLVADTRHFDYHFTNRFLEHISEVDAQIDGTLISSENFQAISLVQPRYREQVSCIYIDPPYNTSENTFVYKNQYRHSSWMTMICDRVAASLRLLDAGGVLECAIDDTETARLRIILDDIFGQENRVATIAVEVNPAGQNLRPNTPALSHDYCHVYARDIEHMTMLTRDLTEEEKAIYTGRDDKGAFLWDNLRRRGGNSRPTDRPGQWYPLYVNPQTKEVSVDRVEGWEEVWPIDPQGERRIWRVNPEGARREIAAGEIGVLEKAGRLEIVKKTRMPEGKKPKTHWTDSKYSATTYGTKLLIDILGEQRFSYPKSLHLVVDCLRYWCDEEAIVLDYFAGSGTTGHAVIALNHADNGKRKFILVEQGDYFDTVLVPRLKKVAYTPEWKNSKPKRFATAEEAERSPRIMKVIRLESYEDTLNNLELRRTEAQQSLLDSPQAQGADGFREQYLLRYMLDVETRGSQSLLNVSAFMDPTAYKLKVKRPGSDESREVNVDLLETFNWLIGLKVDHIAAPRTYSAAFRRDADPDLPADAPRRLLLDGRLKEDPDGPWWFRTVTGTTPDGRRTLVIWRKRPGGEDPEGIERDNLVLDEWFHKQGYSSKDSEFDLIYVNGDNNLENLKAPDDTWKVRLIEEDFFRLMFDTEGV